MAVRHVGDAEKDVEQRGLAASRRAEYGDDLPILDGKIDILEHDMRAIRLLDVPQFEHGTPSRFLASSRPPEGIVPRARKRPARRPLRLPMHVKGYGKEGRCRSALPASRSRLLAGRSRPFARRSPLLAKRRPRHVPTSCHGDVRAIGGGNARAAARPGYCTALT